MRILHLPIKKKFFDMIEAGIKLAEYRSIKPHYVSRFIDFSNYPVESKNEFRSLPHDFCFDLVENNIDFIEALHGCYGKIKNFDAVQLRNGYSKNSPTLLVKWEGLDTGIPKPEWSDGWSEKTFIIKLGEKIITSKQI